MPMFLDEWDPLGSADDLNLWRQWLTCGATTREREDRILDCLDRDISLLDPGLLVIGRDVVTDSRESIDLLCLEATGDVVVIDLKRNRIALQITLQVLDHGSWVGGLSSEDVASIARAHLGDDKFEGTFRDRFGVEVPETLNSDHSVLIVGWRIDEDLERMVRHLSGPPGVGINAVTIHSVCEPDGSEAVSGGSYLIEPPQVELHRCIPAASKQCAFLTEGELGTLADQAGVGELFRYAVASFFRPLRFWPAPESIGFCWLPTGRAARQTVITLEPRKSSAEKGLVYYLNKNTFAALTGLSVTAVMALSPAVHEEWVRLGDPEPERESFWGYIRSRDEIDRLSAALTLRARRI
jgi:hypothetical protein